MEFVILTSKIEVPVLSGDHIVRPRLLQMMDESLHRKMTLICAPAGYGKTSLVASWVQEQGRPVAWISLDARDNDLMRFWLYVSSAVAGAYLPPGDRLPLLFVNRDPSSWEQGLTILLSEMNRIPEPVTLILDDYQTIGLPDIHTTLAYLIERMPTHVHLVLLARAEPPLPVSRLLASGQLNCLSHTDMRFYRDEAVAFFRRRTNGSVADAVIDRWVSRTEGWAVGMQLGALALRQRSPDDVPDRLGGEEHPIADYLWEEVFQQQSVDVQAFMMRTSLLNRMCAPLCDAITGQRNGQDMLERIERNQLFLVPLDRRKEWFRYHHLFSEFLLDRLRKRERDAIPELHAAAASWFEANGYDEEAIEHYLAANQMNRAAEAMLRLLPSRIKQEWSTLAAWIGALPDSVLRAYPRLLLTNIFLHGLLGRIDDAEDELSEWEAWRAEQAGIWPPDEAGELHADTVVTRFYLATERMDLDTVMTCLLEYAREVKKDGLFLSVYHKFNSVSTIRHNPKIGGSPGKAEAFFGSLLQHTISPTIGKAICLHGYAEGMYEWGRLQEAEQYAKECLDIGYRVGYEGTIVSAVVVLVRIQAAKGDRESALRMIQETEAHPAVAVNPYWLNHMNLHRLRILLDSEEGRAVAVEWLDRHPPRLWADTGLLPGWVMFESLMQTRAMIAAEQLDQAAEWLDRLSDSAHKNGFMLDKIEVLILKSRVCLLKDDLQTAVGHFAHALQLALPDKLIRIFVDEGEPAAILLMEYLRLRQSNHIRVSDGVPMQYVKRLATELRLARSARSPTGRPKADSPPMAVPITRMEAKVLKLIQSGLTNSRIAEQLNIGVGTVKTHVQRLYGKLGVNSRFEAIQRSREWSLLLEDDAEYL